MRNTAGKDAAREPCRCIEAPRSETLWYAGEELRWDGDVYSDDLLDELQVIIDRHKTFGRKAAVIHEGCCHYLYLPKGYVEKGLRR